MSLDRGAALAGWRLTGWGATEGPTCQIKRQAGNPAMSGGYVTLAVSGPGTLNAAGGPTTESLFVSGSQNVEVFNETATPGALSSALLRLA